MFSQLTRFVSGFSAPALFQRRLCLRQFLCQSAVPPVSRTSHICILMFQIRDSEGPAISVSSPEQLEDGCLTNGHRDDFPDAANGSLLSEVLECLSPRGSRTKQVSFQITDFHPSEESEGTVGATTFVGNGATFGTSNAKSFRCVPVGVFRAVLNWRLKNAILPNFPYFRNVDTAEKLPREDHYRNVMSFVTAVQSRPTLHELHEGGGDEVAGDFGDLAALDLAADLPGLNNSLVSVLNIN